MVRQALDGLFDIACDDRPASVRDSLHAQIEAMPARQCRGLVEQMVDTEQLAALVREEACRLPNRPPGAPEEHSKKVDEALEPLVAWTCGEEGTQALEAMEDEERLHLLFSSLGPSNPASTPAGSPR